MSEALRTDLYQLTMMQAYWQERNNRLATFDYFVRKIPDRSYLVVAGLEYVLKYLQNLKFSQADLDYLKKQKIFHPDFLKELKKFRFTGDIIGMPEGTITFPSEPILRITAPISEAQLIETFILNKMNFSTLIATKASRVVYAASAKPIAEFGLRRAQADAHLEATRACFIGGCQSTSNVLAGKILGIPIVGTMAHSFITSFDDETESFRSYAKTFPNNTVILIDTYDSIKGAKKAVLVGKELERKGYKLKGVRLDSGNLCQLSKEVRKILDENGLEYVKIFASSDLNEWKIRDLLALRAPIDVFGVGTEMVTGKPNPALGGVYKLAEIIDKNGQAIPKMKTSDEPAKATLPGRKMVWRICDKNGFYTKDLITLNNEYSPEIAGTERLLISLVEKGRIVYSLPSLKQIQEFTQRNLAKLPEKYRQLDNPAVYPVEKSFQLKKLQEELIQKIKS